MPTMIDTNTLLDVSHDIYREAADIILKVAKEDHIDEVSAVEDRARLLMPQKLAHEFFAHLSRCRTQNSRIKALKLLAGICHAMVYERTLENNRKQ